MANQSNIENREIQLHRPSEYLWYCLGAVYGNEAHTEIVSILAWGPP
jgi:hypothetical protein